MTAAWRRRALIVVLLAVAILFQGCASPKQPSFSGQRAYRDVKAQMEIGPRPVGSEGDLRTAQYIVSQLKAAGWEDVQMLTFTFRGTPIRNVLAKSGGDGPPILLGAHFDSRPYADRDPDPTKRHDPMPGANDGASGVAVLLELARSLDRNSLHSPVWLAFFDGEDKGEIDGWPWSVGASHMAETLPARPKEVIVVDMVGDRDQQIYWERNSSPEIQKELWKIASDLGYGEHFIPRYRWGMIDDHTPFLRQGIPAVDIIDFDYPYWHTTADTADKVSPESLKRVGRVLETYLEGSPGASSSN